MRDLESAQRRARVLEILRGARSLELDPGDLQLHVGLPWRLVRIQGRDEREGPFGGLGELPTKLEGRLEAPARIREEKPALHRQLVHVEAAGERVELRLIKVDLTALELELAYPDDQTGLTRRLLLWRAVLRHRAQQIEPPAVEREPQLRSDDAHALEVHLLVQEWPQRERGLQALDLRHHVPLGIAQRHVRQRDRGSGEVEPTQLELARDRLVDEREEAREQQLLARAARGKGQEHADQPHHSAHGDEEAEGESSRPAPQNASPIEMWSAHAGSGLS